MAVTTGDYLDDADVVKKALHISHDNYDDEISKAINAVEAAMNTKLNKHVTTPITKEDDIVQIALMWLVAWFDLVYREGLTPDQFMRAKEMLKLAKEGLAAFIDDNWGGRTHRPKPQVKRVTPDGNNNMITDLFS